jgi:NAD(P)-dependent dehydrogenase (short-subunit alcohol dehydrogenase family)
VTDVTGADAGEVIVQAALAAWGRVDAVINNAGASRGGVELASVTDADFEFTMNVHVMGTVRVTRAAWPHMVARGGGRVVNTSSDSIWGAPVPAYLTAKGAIFGFSRAAAAEGRAHGIAVNTVMPSAWTRMTSGMPPGDFRDVVEATFPPHGAAPMVALLAHPSCPFTGESFQVGANRAARIFTGVTPGYHATSDEPLDELAAHVDDITRLDGWSTPRDMVDSVNVAISHLRTPPTT